MGNSAKVTVKGFESFLSKPVCPEKFQRQCQNQVGDTRCGIDMDTHKYTLVCNSVSSNGLVLTMSGSTTEGILALGYIQNLTGNWTEYRMITHNNGTEVKIRYPFGKSIVGQTCDLFYGCSGDIETCYNDFGNVDNFIGFPYIPIENPARRI